MINILHISKRIILQLLLYKNEQQNKTKGIVLPHTIVSHNKISAMNHMERSQMIRDMSDVVQYIKIIVVYNQQVKQQMPIPHPTTNKTLPFISILTPVSLIIIIALLPSLQMAGFHQPTTSQSPSPYQNIKIQIQQSALKINFIFTILALIISIIVLILVMKYLNRVEAELGQKQQAFYIVINPLTSLEVLLLLTIFLRMVDYTIMNNQLGLMKKQEVIAMLAVSSCILLSGLIKWGLILRYLIDINSALQKQGDSFNPMEDDWNFLAYQKNYFSNSNHHQNQLHSILVHEQQQLYSNIKQGLKRFKETNRFQEEQQQEDGEKDSQLPVRNEGKQEVRRFGLLGGAEQIQQQEDESKSQVQDRTLLKVNKQLDLSEKFQQNNFQLQQDLQKAIAKDKEQDLSPYQLYQLMNFTKEQYELSKNTSTNLSIEKQYSPYKININFMKIKNFKATLQKNNVNFKEKVVNEVAEQQVKEEQVEEPIDRELSILLKTIIFNNSPFYIKETADTQTQCPLDKYIEIDSKLSLDKPEILQDKSKKTEYAKQWLAYYKKAKGHEFGESSKNDLSKEFADLQEIQAKRKLLFKNQLLLRSKMEAQQKKSLYFSKNPLKRKLINYIRSKYQY